MHDIHDPRDTEPSATPAEPERPDYRPVSTLAVAALGLGALSALALVSPVFLVLPLLTLAVAAAALVDVDREGSRKAGRLMALGGLALAAGFGGQAAVGTLATRSIAAARAASAAELFLAAVREGRLADAEAMCGPEARRGIEQLASCPASGPRPRATAGDQPGTWIVRIRPERPGDCDARLVLEPSVVVQQRTRVERWLVTACEVTANDAVRPSAR